jgi:exonuclease III
MNFILSFLYTYVFFFLASSDTQCPNIVVPVNTTKNSPIIRVVQMNAEWLFVDEYALFGCPGEACPWKNTSQAQKHLEYIATIIQDLNPDIINICEVEGCDELKMLVDSIQYNVPVVNKIGRPKVETSTSLYQPYLIQGTDTSTGQNVGLLTKYTPIRDLYRTEARYNYPIPESRCGYIGTKEESTGVSKHYITEFNLSGIPIAFIGVHLLAYPDDIARCAQREAQAMVIQNVVYEYMKNGFEVILLGDMNDFDEMIMDKNNNKPISNVIDILKGNFGDNMFKYELYSVSALVEQEKRYSDWYDVNLDGIAQQTEYSAIDYILVSKPLLDKIVACFYYHKYDKSVDYYASDHFQLVVDFQM